MIIKRALLQITTQTLSEDIEAGARPLNGVDISVVDGELIIKQTNLLNRYFDDEALTLANTGEGGIQNRRPCPNWFAGKN